jgi:hypothetical protein
MLRGHDRPVNRPRAGLLIIRAWVEPGSSSPLRAQLRLTTDVSQGFERNLTVAREDAVMATVRVWLSELLAGAAGEDGADHPSEP